MEALGAWRRCSEIMPQEIGSLGWFLSRRSVFTCPGKKEQSIRQAKGGGREGVKHGLWA